MVKKLLLILLFFLLVPGKVFADSPSITVSPSIIQLDLNQEKPEAELTYTNNSSQTVEIYFSAQDFEALEDGWRVKLLEPKDAKNYKYSLSSWISFNQNSLTLRPKEKGSVTVTVDAKRLTQGGHYATIQAEIRPDKVNGKQVLINGVLSSLLFVRAGLGQVREDAKINQFGPVQETFVSFPSEMYLRFQNIGNVDLTPYGLVEIKDMFGRKVARGILNEGSFITLPESIRRYDIQLIDDGFKLPGIYKATISLRYGKSNMKITSSTSFFSQGSFNFILAIPVVAIIVIGLVIISKRSKKEL